MDDRLGLTGQDWRICLRVGLSAGLILGMIGGFGAQELFAAEPAQHSLKLIAQQFESSGAERFTINPRGVTLTAKQGQRFAVIDVIGRPAAVRWNISGLSCSGLACGTIDEDGDYLAPDSVTRAQVVVLEGVLVSDPNHSVLTRISLVPAGNARASTGDRRGRSSDSAVAASFASNGSGKREPEVTYEHGQLTIDAENVTLAEVLGLVARTIGAVIEVPSGAGLERIVEHAGPASANEVLAQLLNGSRFNFVIVNSPQTPYEVAQVMLSLRGEEAAASPVSSASTGSIAASPTERIPPDVLEQMLKDKAREIRESTEQR